MLQALWLISSLLPSLVSARPSSYAVWAADSAIKRGQGNGLDSSGNPSVNYEHGELQWGLSLLYEATGNKTYYDYIVSGASKIVSDSGAIASHYNLADYSLDPVRTGPTFLYLYKKTGQAKWKTAANTFRKQLETHPRTAQGQYWHKLRYFNQGWLDGIYMGDIFYAHYTNDFQRTNATAWTDLTNQFNLMYQNTQGSSDANNKGLLYHGYDYSHTASWASSDRGHSPEVWDRALGWYMMALVDVLEIIPTSQSANRAIIFNILRTLAPKIRDAADPSSGVWWLVMSQPGRAGNYFESSGSAMFVYSLLKAVRLGYIPDTDGSIVKAMRKAYTYITTNWVVANSDGTMNWKNTVEVGSLSGNGTYEYYISVPLITNDLKGLAAFLLASLEYEKL